MLCICRGDRVFSFRKNEKNLNLRNETYDIDMYLITPID